MHALPIYSFSLVTLIGGVVFLLFAISAFFIEGIERDEAG